MIVVSDTSPIVSLAIIDRLDLLRQLYGRLVIPQAVRDEIVVSGNDQPGGHEVASLDWIEARPVDNPIMIALLLRELDRGEAEAITLTIEAKADLLLIDERKARSVAAYLGLPINGLLDILVEAKRAHLIDAVKPPLDELIVRARFRISKKLYQRILKSVGE